MCILCNMCSPINLLIIILAWIFYYLFCDNHYLSWIVINFYTLLLNKTECNESQVQSENTLIVNVQQFVIINMNS